MAVTIYDVARHAGVSPRTVSNVVNDYPFVADSTRSLVQASIATLGYRPNLTARNLRQGKTGVIAIAIPELRVPYFSELAEAVIDIVAERSYTVMIEQTGGDPAEERKLIAERVHSGLFDGLILSPLGIGSEDLAVLPGPAPVVLLGERVHAGPFDHVAIDNIAAARDAVRHLTDLGRRRIAAIGAQTYETSDSAKMRTAGYRQVLAETGIRYDKKLVISTPRFYRELGAKAMEQLLALARPPDAVFCYNDLLAIGALRTMLQHGVRVPEDIALVGFDDNEEGRYSTPTLTTIAPDKAVIAQRAVEQLFRRIDGGREDPVDISAPYRLEIRESSAGTSAGPTATTVRDGSESIERAPSRHARTVASTRVR